MARALAVLLLTTLALPAKAKVLTVGPGRSYARIEAAVRKARPDDLILVYPRQDYQPYAQVAVLVTRPRITIRGVLFKGRRIPLSGKGFVYSGRGKIPRAVFQFNPAATGCLVEGFEISDARNKEGNASGVRINQANHVTLRNLELHHNDMGVMSAGNGSLTSALNQRILRCSIHHNGSPRSPGLSHNLYLGGASVTISGCEIHHSTTGHNVKSRAHHTRVEYSHIHDSANREFDLVDGHGETSAPNSDAVILGCLIVKAAKIKGNKAVIHFGQDGGRAHNGTLHLVHNTVITPYQSAVLNLSAPGAKLVLRNNLIWGTRKPARKQRLLAVRKGAKLSNAGGEGNWLSAGFAQLEGSKIDPQKNRIAASDRHPSFDASYRLRAGLGSGLPWKRLRLPPVPGAPRPRRPKLRQYKQPLQLETRRDAKRPQVGAFSLGR